MVVDRAAGDDQGDVAVVRVGAAVLGDLRLLAGVDDAVLGDAEDVRHARVGERGAEEFGGFFTGVDLAEAGAARVERVQVLGA